MDGNEMIESDGASIVGWDGSKYVLSSKDLPRVASISERALREHLPWRESVLATNGSMPVVLINAIKGACRLQIPNREPFPEKAVKAIDELFETLTRRP
jgi:hypothetical protein